MRLWPAKQVEVGWAPCVLCRKPRPVEELSPSQVCVACWIRSGTEKGWALDAPVEPQARAVWALDRQCVAPDFLAEVTLLGEEGREHVLTSMHGSFNGAHVGLFAIRIGAGPPKKLYCHTGRDVVFGEGLRTPPGESLMIGLQFRNEPRTLPPGASACILAVGYTKDAK